MNKEVDVLGFKSQGLDNHMIAEAIGCNPKDVPALIENSLKAQYGDTAIPKAVLIELTRADRLIAKMFDDLDSCEDVYSEITGKMERDGYKMRSAIAATIAKLIETKIKLFNLSIVYKEVTENEDEETVDINSMSLEQKLEKFRRILEE